MAKEGKMHIVLADDDQDDRELFREAIEELNLDVELTLFKNGDELLDYLHDPENEKLPHILFLDLNMLCTKYDDCLKEIRRHSRFKDLSIAIYSTSSSETDVHATFVGGANIYIKKPNDFEVLKQSLREVLKINWQFHTSGLDKGTFLFRI
ncbi:Response regulator rcp1 [compost metagenome]